MSLMLNVETYKTTQARVRFEFGVFMRVKKPKHVQPKTFKME